MASDFDLDEIERKIKEMKEELIYLEIQEHCNFPLSYTKLPFLTDDTKKLIYNFTYWLCQNKIALESLNQWEMGHITRIFARQKGNMHLTKKMKETLKEVIIGSKKWLSMKEKKFVEDDELHDKIIKYEKELIRLKMQENYNFHIPYVELPSLTEGTRNKIYRLAYWLNKRKIVLECLNQWEMGFIGKLFAREEVEMDISKKMNEILKEIMVKSNKWINLKKKNLKIY